MLVSEIEGGRLLLAVLFLAVFTVLFAGHNLLLPSRPPSMSPNAKRPEVDVYGRPPRAVCQASRTRPEEKVSR